MSEDLEIAGRYLRGELGEEQIAVFEARLLADAGLHVAVRVAEDELIEDYALGRLSALARARVRDRLGADPELRERLTLIVALRRCTARAPVARAPEVATTPRRRAWFAGPALALAAAAALALAAWPRSEAGHPIVELPLAAPTRGRELPVLRLAPAARTVRLVVAPGDGFALVGPQGAVPTTARGSTAVELDARALVDGLYELTTGDPAVSYQLRVVREPR